MWYCRAPPALDTRDCRRDMENRRKSATSTSPSGRTKPARRRAAESTAHQRCHDLSGRQAVRVARLQLLDHSFHECGIAAGRRDSGGNSDRLQDGRRDVVHGDGVRQRRHLQCGRAPVFDAEEQLQLAFAVGGGRREQDDQFASLRHRKNHQVAALHSRLNRVSFGRIGGKPFR